MHHEYDNVFQTLTSVLKEQIGVSSNATIQWVVTTATVLDLVIYFTVMAQLVTVSLYRELTFRKFVHNYNIIHHSKFIFLSILL